MHTPTQFGPASNLTLRKKKIDAVKFDAAKIVKISGDKRKRKK